MITDKQRSLIAVVCGHQRYHGESPALEAEFARLNARVAHLEGLVKQAEDGDDGFKCPWCKSPDWLEQRHDDDCPAFTPGGDVK